MKTVIVHRMYSVMLVATCASLGACASSRSSESSPSVAGGEGEGHHHPELAPATVVELGAGKKGISVEPATAKVDATPEVPTGQPPITRVPLGGTVFFRNAEKAHFIQLAVSGDFETCAGCVSVTNFTCLKHGALATAIEPGGMSTLCFHKVGRYPFRVTGGDENLIGYLEVFSPDVAQSIGKGGS